MVLNNHKPYDIDSSGDEDDPWEFVAEHEAETTPLAAAAAEVPAVPDDGADAGGDQTESAAEHESPAEIDVLNKEGGEGHDDGNASVVSDVSSVTGDHHTVSDVDEDEAHEDEGDSTLDDDGEVPASSPTDLPEKKDGDGAEESPDSDSDPLVEQLSQMGFEKEQIEKAIGDLREAGATDIDADSVIGSMMGESSNSDGGRAHPLGRTWEFVESTVQDLDNQHQLRRRTQNCVRNVSQSAQEFWSNVREESQRFKSNLRETCDQADVQAREATTQVRYAASSAKDSIRRANEEYRITEKVAAVAVIGGATLLALGNPRAGVGAMAVAGATLAAGEAMKNSPGQPGSTYTRDHGLPKGVHLD